MYLPFSAKYNVCCKVFAPLCLLELSVCSGLKKLIGTFVKALKHCNEALGALSQPP